MIYWVTVFILGALLLPVVAYVVVMLPWWIIKSTLGREP